MQQVKWNTRFNFRSAEPSEVVQFSVGVNNPDDSSQVIHELNL